MFLIIFLNPANIERKTSDIMTTIFLLLPLYNYKYEIFWCKSGELEPVYLDRDPDPSKISAGNRRKTIR